MPDSAELLQTRQPSRKALPVGEIKGTVHYYLRKGARRHFPLPILRCIFLKLFCAGIKPKRVRFVDVRLDDDPAFMRRSLLVCKPLFESALRECPIIEDKLAPSIFVDDPET